MLNKEKYRKEVTKNLDKLTDERGDTFTPEGWPTTKQALGVFISEMDELHEVYTLENTKKV